MNNKIICCLLISFFSCVYGQEFYAQTAKKTTSVNVSQNNPTPNFYGEKLDFWATLVDLPGAKLPQSSWQVFYDIYFVGEAEFDKSIQKIGKVEKLANGAERRTINHLTVEDFPNKLLLANGNFNKKSLTKISDRIVEKNEIDFGKKIAKDLKTERGKIIVSYTVKIYDAALKKNIYKTRLFIQSPFIVNENGEKQARSELFLSFYVTKDGNIYDSSLARDKTSTSW